jgi:hypothetical protein
LFYSMKLFWRKWFHCLQIEVDSKLLVTCFEVGFFVQEQQNKEYDKECEFLIIESWNIGKIYFYSHHVPGSGVHCLKEKSYPKIHPG